MIKKWAKAIVKLYQEVVVPQWELKDTPVMVNPSYASKIENLELSED
jgi:hypothetical protein